MGSLQLYGGPITISGSRLGRSKGRKRRERDCSMRTGALLDRCLHITAVLGGGQAVELGEEGLI